MFGIGLKTPSKQSEKQRGVSMNWNFFKSTVGPLMVFNGLRTVRAYKRKHTFYYVAATFINGKAVAASDIDDSFQGTHKPYIFRSVYHWSRNLGKGYPIIPLYRDSVRSWCSGDGYYQRGV